MEERPSNNNQPATQRDLDTWGGQLTQRIDGVEKRVRGIEDNMSTKDDLERFRAEIVHEFKAAVENITEQLKGANRDEISSLQDGRAIHEERIGRLEERAGLR